MFRKIPVFCLALVAGVVGCSEPADDSGAIARDQFIEVYVDLRIEAPIEELPDGEPADPELLEARDRVLERHGVEADDLLHFVEVHGEDLSYMHEVWAEIDARLAARSVNGETEPGDTTGAGDTTGPPDTTAPGDPSPPGDTMDAGAMPETGDMPEAGH